jgi:nitrate/nitrite-specific signal transduction histidine kinase
LEVELTYGQDLALRVADNGVGIDSEVADRGKDGHFGIQGMRERAVRIGGRLTLESSPNSGTEMKLIVPGSIVSQKLMQPSPFARLRTLVRRKGHASKLD